MKAPILDRQPWLSLEITACILIQSFYRGYQTRSLYPLKRIFKPLLLPRPKKTFMLEIIEKLQWSFTRNKKIILNWAEREASLTSGGVKRGGEVKDIKNGNVRTLGKDGILFGDH
ncbi:hypothetical protein TrVE_jg10528 [Triparma verrucosa]|uniref:Uncharacterized protein n=1 Tax=Triparma verrucosa TaxID=1606542 RepID=A0A9W7FL45_9STRA|nr:hypothetical protein TrVE_jg10528 [Triparma verrucosa]